MIGEIISDLKENSSEDTVELYHNSSCSGCGFEFYKNEEENILQDDKPILNINTLQSIRISHSIDNSKNSQSLIDILNENKIINLNNNFEENNENDANVNNKANKNIKNKSIKNKKEENNSRNIKLNEYSSIHSNYNKGNNIYDKFKIGDIFKEKFEEKTKSFKSIHKMENNNPQKNNNNSINEEMKPKTSEYQNYIKNSNNKVKYISNVKKNINNEFLYIKENDSFSIEPDSIEINNNKNKKSILNTLEIQNSSEKDDKNDKNIIVSELDCDISNSITKNKNINNVKLEKAIENNIKKGIIDINHLQKQLNDKSKNINKKIYTIRKINLNSSIYKKNVIQLKKRLSSEKNNNKHKNYHPSSSIKIQKAKNQRNLYLKQVLDNSNISSYYRLNTSTNLNNKRALYKKSAYTNIKQFNSKSKISSKSIYNE